MTEIYKIINQTAPPIMSSLFEIRGNTHSMRHFEVHSNKSKRTVNFGSDVIEQLFFGQIYCQNIILQIL